MFFEGNLRFAHAYTPPPQFQIPRNNPASQLNCPTLVYHNKGCHNKVAWRLLNGLALVYPLGSTTFTRQPTLNNDF